MFFRREVTREIESQWDGEMDEEEEHEKGEDSSVGNQAPSKAARLRGVQVRRADGERLEVRK